ncbi:hypothetical protein INR49_030166 [Caranx melampygus]|nr:hypothetical protein INR49_030166 [Caranx melampygus]
MDTSHCQIPNPRSSFQCGAPTLLLSWRLVLHSLQLAVTHYKLDQERLWQASRRITLPPPVNSPVVLSFVHADKRDLRELWEASMRFLGVKGITVSDRVLCNDPEVVLPPRKQSSDSVPAAEDTFSHSEPGGGAGVSFEDDIMRALTVISQIWSVIPLQGHCARDLLLQVEIPWRSRKV